MAGRTLPRTINVAGVVEENMLGHEIHRRGEALETVEGGGEVVPQEPFEVENGADLETAAES